jgi:hypothetical protein
LSWNVLTSSLRMSLLQRLLWKKYSTITLCSIRSIQIFIIYISNPNWKQSSAPDHIDRFSRWTHMINSEIDWILRMLFGHWRFSVQRKIGRRSDIFWSSSTSL